MNSDSTRTLAYKLAVNYAVYRTLLAMLGVRNPTVYVIVL